MSMVLSVDPVSTTTISSTSFDSARRLRARCASSFFTIMIPEIRSVGGFAAATARRFLDIPLAPGQACEQFLRSRLEVLRRWAREHALGEFGSPAGLAHVDRQQ